MRKKALGESPLLPPTNDCLQHWFRSCSTCCVCCPPISARPTLIRLSPTRDIPINKEFRHGDHRCKCADVHLDAGSACIPWSHIHFPHPHHSPCYVRICAKRAPAQFSLYTIPPCNTSQVERCMHACAERALAGPTHAPCPPYCSPNHHISQQYIAASTPMGRAAPLPSALITIGSSTTPAARAGEQNGRTRALPLFLHSTSRLTS